MLLNEGGGGSLQDGKVSFGIEVTQKVPFWIRLVATGEPGHGAMPRAESAVTLLVHALEKIHVSPFLPRICPVVDAYFKALAPHVGEEWQAAFADMTSAVRDPTFLTKLQNYDPSYHALIRNTVSITRLKGSRKINEIPPSAAAELDCRILPDQDPEEFLNTLRSVINDPSIAIETILLFTPAVSTSDTHLYRAIEKVIGKHFPGAPILQNVARGFTDSHFFRDLGIACYGFTPAVIPHEDSAGAHGNNERISVENVCLMTQLTLEILQEVVFACP